MKSSIDVICKGCNNTFSTANKKRKFCSKTCYHFHWYRQPGKKLEKYNQSIKWHKENPVLAVDKQLRHKYGISLDKFLEMSASQDHKCKICLLPCSVKPKLSVDHCHGTGKIRGLLCDRCNKGLGSFRDNEQSLVNAANYLKESRQICV